jgi:RNA polymerase sigma-70 factor, ECF subfamily
VDAGSSASRCDSRDSRVHGRHPLFFCRYSRGPRDTKTQPVPSLSAIYREHFAYIWAVLRRLGVPEADLEDLVQEVFVVAHRRLHTFEQRSSIRTWLYAIAVRLYLNDSRRRSRRGSPVDVSSSNLPIADDGLDPEAHTARAQARRMLGELLENLDADKRVVFVLSELEGLPAPAIARITGANTRTVYSRLRAARDRFSADLARFHARERNDLTVRALVAHGRTRVPPPAGAQRRVHAAIMVQLGHATVGTGGVLAMGWKAAALSLGLGLAPIAVIVGVRSGTPASTDAVVVSTSDAQRVVDAEPPAPASPPQVSAPSTATAATQDDERPTTIARTRVRNEDPPSNQLEPVDVLSQELELMGRARAALREADPARALALLDEHARRFPSGTLAQERERSRLTALCEAGLESEAEALANRLGQPHCDAGG